MPRKTNPLFGRQQKNPPRAELAVEAAIADAQAARLRYVSDTKPGIRRERAGRGFKFVGPAGREVTDAATLERIRGRVRARLWRVREVRERVRRM